MSSVSVVIWRNISEGILVQKNDIALKSVKLGQNP